MSCSSYAIITVLLIGLSVIGASEAQQLGGVKFRQFNTFSRVVFDFSHREPYVMIAEATPYKVFLSYPQMKELPDKRLWVSNGRLIKAVRFVAGPKSVQAEISLLHPGRVSRHFRLAAPDRVVIDVMRQKVADQPRVGSVAMPLEPSGSLPPATLISKVSPVPAKRDSQPPTHSREPKLSTARKTPNLSQPEGVTAKPLPTSMSAQQMLKEAEREWHAKQYDKAESIYQTFLSQFPKHAQNHLIAIRLADMLREQKQYRKALDAYANVGASYPQSQGALISQIRLAELHLTFPDLIPTAVAESDQRYLPFYQPYPVLQQLVREYPFHSLSHVARYTMGLLLLKRSDIAGGFETFQMLLDRELEPPLRLQVQDKARYTLGLTLAAFVKRGAYVEALQLYFQTKAKLASTDGMQPDLILPVVDSYAGLGLLEEAAHLLEIVLDTSPLSQPKRQAVKLKRAQLLFQQELTAEAKTLLQPLDAFTEAPLRRQARRLLGEVALKEGQLQQAAHYLLSGGPPADDASETARLYAQLARAYEKKGVTDQAHKVYQQCAEVRGPEASIPLPQAEVCLFRLGQLQQGGKQGDKAIATYEALLQAFPQSVHREQVLFHLADLYRQGNDATRMQERLNQLEEQSQSSFWQALVDEFGAERTWRERFHDHLSRF